MVLLDTGPTAAQAGGAAAASVVFGFGAVIAGRKVADLVPLATLAGLVCCGFAALAGMIAADGCRTRRDRRRRECWWAPPC